MTERISRIYTTALILLVSGGYWCALSSPGFAASSTTSNARTASFFDVASEALTYSDEDSEAFRELTTQLQQQLLKGEGVALRLESLQHEERIRYRDFLMERMAQDPDDTIWESHYRWQSLAALVYHVDPAAYKEDLQQRAVDLATQHFQEARLSFQGELNELPRHFRALTLDAYRTLIVSAPGVTEVCAAYLQDVEYAIRQMDIESLQELVRIEQDVIFEQIEKRRKEATKWLAKHTKKDKRFHRSRGTYTYTSTLAGKHNKWLIELDTIFPGAGYDGFLTFRSKLDTNLSATIRSDVFIAMLASDGIDDFLEDAAFADSPDQLQKGKLLEYDLPEEVESAYLRFLPRSYGSAEFGFLLSSFVRSAALYHRYGERVAHSEVIFTNALADSLSSALYRIQEQDISSVIIEFDSHGVQNGFQYGEDPLSPEAITRLVVLHPDIQFLLRTPACYGGKLRDALLSETKHDASLGSRVTFFSQSKPENPNILYFGSALDTSVYDLFLLQNLLDSRITTYGEAAERAGKMTREVYWTNAEVVYQGRLMP